MIFLSTRLHSIQPSPTLALNARAKTLKAQGIDIINLAQVSRTLILQIGSKRAIHAMDQGLTKYTAVDGLPSLKEAIRNKFIKDNNLEYSLNEITVANGESRSYLMR